MSKLSYARRDHDPMGKPRHYSEQEFEALVSSALVNPTAPMPSFQNLPPKKFTAVVYFLSQLR